MSRSQPKLPTALRICAAATVVLWVTAVGLCKLECLSECDGHVIVAYHDESKSAEHGHSQATSHSHDAGEHSHGSHHHDGDKSSCCSTLKAAVQIGKPIVIAKPLLQPLKLISALLEASASDAEVANTVSVRQAEHCKWVFTPEVCLGPAFRSHAPPSLN